MVEKSPLVITISHQFGSGGAYIGQKIAKDLDFLYFDREIIVQVAKKLGVLEESIAEREEKATSKWEFIINTIAHADLSQISSYTYSEADLLSDEEIYKAESEIISKISQEKSCVILGRGGSFILRQHPKHVSVFLHSNVENRSRRVKELFNISENEAVKLVERKDKERSRYINKFTGQDINNARLYDLSINTGTINLDKIEEFILKYVNTKLDEYK